jgi:hypothetical protein
MAVAYHGMPAMARSLTRVVQRPDQPARAHGSRGLRRTDVLSQPLDWQSLRRLAWHMCDCTPCAWHFA